MYMLILCYASCYNSKSKVKNIDLNYKTNFKSRNHPSAQINLQI